MAVTDRLVVVFDADFQRIKGALRKLDTTVRQTLRDVERRFDKLGRKMEKTGKKMSSSLSLPIALIGGYAIKMAGDFEASMNRVAAVSNATQSQFDALNSKAKELGATTQFTASQVAEGMKFLAMAGFEPAKIIGAIEPTLKLAAAANLDLGQSADIVTNIMTGYGQDVSQLGDSVDDLTTAFTSANTDLSQLGVAFTYAGGVAKATGQDFTQVVTALALMSNANFKAQMGGTALRGAMTRLIKPTGEVARAMKAAGLNFSDGAGGLINIREIVKQLKPHINDAALFMTLFGQRAGPGMLGLIRQGLPAFDKLNTALKHNGDVADRIARIQLRGFNGAILLLKSSVEGFAIAVGDSGVLAFMTGLAKKFTEMFRWLAKLNPKILATGTAIVALVAVLGPLILLMGVLAKVIKLSAAALLLFTRRIVLIPAIVLAAIVAIKNLAGAIGDFWDALWSKGEDAGEAFVDGFINRFKQDFEKAKAGVNYAFGDLIDTEGAGKLGEDIKVVDAEIKAALAKNVGKGGVSLPLMIDETDKQISKIKTKLAELNTEALLAQGKNVEVLQARFNAELAAFRKMLEQKLISVTEFEKARANLTIIHAKKLQELEGGAFQNIQNAMQSVASNIENALSSAFDTGKFKAKDMVRAIIKDLVMLQIKAAVLKPLFGGGGGAGGGGMIGNLLAGVLHGGGIAGQGGMRRAVPAMAFANAPRFHTGGIAGFKANEFPAVLERGEGIIPKQEMQRSASGVPIVFNVTTPDAESFRRSEGQIAGMIARAAGRGRRGM